MFATTPLLSPSPLPSLTPPSISVSRSSLPSLSSFSSLSWSISSLRSRSLCLLPPTSSSSSLPLPPACASMPSPSLPAGSPLPSGYEKNDPYSLLPPRRGGILLHPTSLPGPYGIGEIGGEEPRKFLDWVADTGCSIWQVLPLVPPGRKSGEDGSPYSGQDANCGNTLLISLDELVAEGLLDKEDLPTPIPVARVDYDEVGKFKDPLVQKAAKKLVSSSGPLKKELEDFISDPNISVWLLEAALFAAIDNAVGEEFWWLWPADLRDRHPEALEKARIENKDFIDVFIAEQFLFQKQWQSLHAYANSRGIRIIGDMPIYVGGHSADTWANRDQFMMDPVTGVPTLVSGVPPDAFSATGQLWGSPLYNWAEMEKKNYSWWAQRMRRAFDLYDEFRIDHFRGLAGYWAIEADSETAMNGVWMQGPGESFFKAIKEAVGKVDIIAEDLGVITTDVVELRKAIDAPGMAVLQFAFGSDSRNPHLPHNHEPNMAVYPGTHDNDTVVGWWSKAQDYEKANTLKHVVCEGDGDIHWGFIRCAFSSVARISIVAMQDVLGLDNSARMNIPAVQKGNWGWRVGESGIFESLTGEADKISGLLKDFNRLPRGWKKPTKEVLKEEAVAVAAE